MLGALKALLLVHGAGSGPSVFEGWAIRGVQVQAVDLQGGLNVEAASMLNFEAVAVRAAGGLERPLGLVGWSMGGLVAMMAARRIEPDRLVLLEPSPPAEIQGSDPTAEPPGGGLFDPERVYGPFPPGVRARPESVLARVERKRGISVPSLPWRTLVVYGEEFPDARGRDLVRFYGAEELYCPGASHWDLVLDPAARTAVIAWLRD